MQHDKELPKWYMQIIDKLHIYTRFKAITKDINPHKIKRLANER